MQTVKFNKEYIEQIKGFFNVAENTVDLSPEFFETANLIAAESADSEKLSKLLLRKYTVVTRENDDIYGLASMDGEGNVGLLYVREDADLKKTSFALLRALERRAEKKGIGSLNVLSTDKSYVVLSAFGFEAYDSQEGGEAFMVKEIRSKDQEGFSQDKVKRYTLDPSKPIVAEGKIPWWPSLLFGISCFFVVLLIGIMVGNYFNPSGAFGNGNKNILIAVVSVLFVVSLAILIFFSVKKSKLRKEILSMQVTNAVIVSDVSCVSNYRRGDNGREEKTSIECSFTYEYYDMEMKSHTGKFYCKYQNRAPYFYKGQELIVAYSGDKSYLLKKYSFLGGESLLDVPSYDEEESISSDVKTMSPQEAERANLTPLEASPIYYLYPASMFGMLVIVAAIVLIAALILKSQTGYVSSLLWVFLAVCTVILGGIGGYFLAQPLRAVKKYKNLRKSNVRYVKGKLKCGEKTYSNKAKNAFYCVFRTVYGQEKRIGMKSTYVALRLQAGEDDVTVAYDDSEAVVLVPKESLSNAIKRGRRRNL